MPGQDLEKGFFWVRENLVRCLPVEKIELLGQKFKNGSGLSAGLIMSVTGTAIHSCDHFSPHDLFSKLTFASDHRSAIAASSSL
jgi:hypothetical protein